MQKTTRQYLIENEKELDDIVVELFPGDRIFFVGDLGAGKTTLIRHILRKYTGSPDLIVRSPTYTYYEKYDQRVGLSENQVGEKSYPTVQLSNCPTIFHFDLYRLDAIDTFYSIGGIEIAEDPASIMLIEWPEILRDLITPTKKISLTLREDGKREVIVEEHMI